MALFINAGLSRCPLGRSYTVLEARSSNAQPFGFLALLEPSRQVMSQIYLNQLRHSSQIKQPNYRAGIAKSQSPMTLSSRSWSARSRTIRVAHTQKKSSALFPAKKVYALFQFVIRWTLTFQRTRNPPEMTLFNVPKR